MSNDTSPVRERLKLASAACALILTALYFAPLSVLLLNAAEVVTSPFGVVGFSWTLQLLLIAVTVFVLFFLPSRLRRIVACLIVTFAGLVYLQGNFFVWDYGPLDGTDIDWDAHNLAGIIEIVCWVGLPLLSILFVKKLWPHIHTLALVVILLQLASLGVHLASGKSFTSARSLVNQELDEEFFEFSGKKNILVIVLDTFSTPLFETIIKERPSLTQKLSGFTNFSNTLGVSPYTLLSIPTILSSRVYENSGTIQSFMRESFGQNSLPGVLQKNGYKASVITMGAYRDYLQWLPGFDISSILYEGDQDGMLRANLQIWDVTLFRHVPHFLKQKVYDKHKWWLQSQFFSTAESRSATQKMEPTPVQLASSEFLVRLAKYASVNSEFSTFKFIHLFTSHPPYLMEENGDLLSESDYEARTVEERAFQQSAFALNQILDVLEKLKQLNIYDETMIVVAGDHGTDITKKTRPVYKRRAQPVLLIKPFHQEGDLQSSQAPTSLLDISATISKEVLGSAEGFGGYAILDEEIPQDRVRNYYYFNWSGKEFWNVDHLPFLDKFEVTGPAGDLGSWKKSCNLQYAENRADPC
jgi:hypothetical protein